MQSTANDTNTTSTNFLSIFNMCLSMIKTKAQHDEDGNTVALVSRIQRDIATLHPQYHDFDPAVYSGEKKEYDGRGNLIEHEQPLSEQDPLFLKQSYEKTGAQDVNQVPYPPTGEENSAPFVSRADTSVGEDGVLKNDPSHEDAVTTTNPKTKARSGI